MYNKADYESGDMMKGKTIKVIIGFVAVVMVIGVAGYYTITKLFPPIPKIDKDEMNMLLDNDDDYCYFYEGLDNEKEQIIYKMIFFGVSHYYEKIAIDDSNVDQVQAILVDVIYDHPELYYVNSAFQYQDYGNYISFIPTYDYTQAEVEKIDNQIQENTKSILETASQQTTSLSKAKVIYDYVVEKNEYVAGKNDQNITSSLVSGKTVCAGYARAYQYLMNRAGEKCAYIVGTANESNLQTQTGDGHAWAMLNIEDDYYYCDPTWGDYIEKGYQHTCYGYFMMNSDDMLSCYTPEGKYEKTKGQTLNYFKDQGSYMTSYSKSIMSNAIKIGLNNKTRVAEIKCANKSVYETVKKKLESNYLGYEVLSENHCYSEKCQYAYDDKLMLIELYY